jgi:hypothetical protein
MLFAFLCYKVYEKKRFLNAISADIDKIKLEVNNLHNFSKKTEIATTYVQRSAFITKILKDTYDLIARDIPILGLNYDGKEIISYKGISKDMTRLLDFAKRLENTEYFKKVEVKYATKKMVKGEELVDFEIWCQVTNELSI